MDVNLRLKTKNFVGRGQEPAQMTYHFTKTVDMSFDDAVMSTKEALKRHNYRVLTEIDMKANFKKELNVDFRPYLIIGVCKPQLSYRALPGGRQTRNDVTMQRCSAATRGRPY